SEPSPHCNISVAYNVSRSLVCPSIRHCRAMKQSSKIMEIDSAALIAGALPMPLLVIGPSQEISFVNPAAEQFFDSGAGHLLRQTLVELVPFGSPLLQLVSQARERNASVSERDVDLTMPRNGERVADVIATPLPEPEGSIVLLLQERSLAQRIDRQLSHRGAVRSMHGMAAVLAHEIKNPLAGIRGAAQLIEESGTENDKALTQLICDESDRIRA